MADLDVKRADPLSIWTEPLEAWWLISEISTDRSRRAVLAFGRLSVWMAMQGLGAQDLDEDVIDEYIGVEQQRSRSRLPAAAQYLPLVKRLLTSHGVLVLRGPVSRGREGRPRLEGGPLDCVVLDLVAWLKDQGYAAGTVAPVACTAARLSCWMADRRLAAQDLDQDVLAQFVASQGRGPHRHPSSARRMVTVRKFLIATGLLVPAPPPPVAFTPVARVLEEWTGYLRAARGISQGWAGEVRGWAEEFLTEQTVGPDGQLVWAGVDPAAVNRYVTSRGQGLLALLAPSPGLGDAGPAEMGVPDRQGRTVDGCRGPGSTLAERAGSTPRTQRGTGTGHHHGRRHHDPCRCARQGGP